MPMDAEAGLRRIIPYFRRLGNARKPSRTNNSAGIARDRVDAAVTSLEMIISLGMQPDSRIFMGKNCFGERLVALDRTSAATGTGRGACCAESSIIRVFIST